MVILRVSERTLDAACQILESHAGFFDGFEIEAESLEQPEREDWDAFSRRAMAFGIHAPPIKQDRAPATAWRATGFRILSLPNMSVYPGRHTIEFYRTLFERRLFDMVRLQYEKDQGDEGIQKALEQNARQHGVGVIRSIRVQAIDGERDTSLYPNHILEGMVKGKDVLHITLNPSGWKDLGFLLERVILDRRVEKKGIRKSFSVEGPYGFPFQVLAGYFGSHFTFTSPQTTGPLIDPISLQRVYRYSSIGPHTALFGIIGNPVLHSRSPHLHNRGYEALGIDAVYVPFPVDDLESFFPVARTLRIRGLSVTIPHKEGVLNYCDWYEDAVLAVGACNTLVLSEGSIKGYNTDVEGFLEPLKGAFPTIKGLKALVIGAGGASRSVVYGLAREGARVLILNRTAERAEGVAKEMEKVLSLPEGTITAAPLDREGVSKVEQFMPDLVVQTTSCGMHPREEEDPFPQLSFRGQEVVYDLVYAPKETRFLKRAMRAGCRVIYGDAMLIHQAFRQFLLFTGREYPRQLIEGI